MIHFVMKMNWCEHHTILLIELPNFSFLLSRSGSKTDKPIDTNTSVPNVACPNCLTDDPHTKFEIGSSKPEISC